MNFFDVWELCESSHRTIAEVATDCVLVGSGYVGN